MRLKQLQLKNFRKFSDLTLDFAPGVNVIVGPNEQGKSTIVHALVAGLFYDPLKKPSQDVLRHQKWNQDELYEIRMIFDSEGDEYTLIKDFQNKELLLRGPQGTHWKTFPEVSKKIAQLTGLSTATLFESSACIHQDSVSEIHASKAELERVLQELVTTESQDVNVLTLLRALVREVNALKKGWDRTVADPGVMRKTRDALEAAEAEFATMQASASEVSKFQSTERETSVLLRQAHERLAVVADLVTSNTKRREVTEGLARARADFSEAEGKQHAEERLKQELQQRSTALNQYNTFLQPNAASVFENILAVNAVLEAQKKDLSKKTLPDSHQSKRPLDVIYFVLAGVSALGGVFGFFQHPGFFALFLATAVFAGLGIFERLRSRKVLVAVSGREHETAAEIQQKETELSRLLSSFGVTNISELHKKRETFAQAQQQLRETEVRLDELHRSFDAQELSKARMNAAARVVALENELASLPQGKTLDPEKLVVLEQEQSDLQKQISQFEETLRTSKALIEHTGVDEGQLTELSERITQLKGELTLLQNRLFIYEKIGITLKAAQMATMSSVRETLQVFIQEHLPKITNGRYEEVQVGPNLEIAVKSPDSGQFINPRENVSRGTIDQIYLMARFALAHAQAKGKYPPFLLDDPFVTFDAGRKKETSKLLQDFAKTFQIFLFTYSDEYSAFADKVIEL